MNVYCTVIHAIDQRTGEMNKFVGENVESISQDAAQEWCNIHKPYLKVIGRLVVTGTCSEEGLTDSTDFDIIANN